MPRAPTFLSPFELMYGRSFLLGSFQLPKTPLSNCLPTLNFTCQLLQEFADKILPQPCHANTLPISFQSGGCVVLKNHLSKISWTLQPKWQGPYLPPCKTTRNTALDSLIDLKLYDPKSSKSYMTPSLRCSWQVLGPTTICLTQIPEDSPDMLTPHE